MGSPGRGACFWTQTLVLGIPKMGSPGRGACFRTHKLGQMFNDIFKMMVDTHMFVVLDTFIRSDPLESLTENDATGGAHLFRPTTDFVYGVKGRFWRKCPKIKNMDQQIHKFT